jgi:3-phenylpropionate/trans-cinnamate dioxygenase ferredoxin component
VAWHEVAALDALKEDEALGVEVGRTQIVLCLSGGELHALDNVCTHQYALLSDGYVEDGCIECPLHQGRFDLKTGEPFGGPVDQPVKVYPVRTDGGKVFVEIPD